PPLPYKGVRNGLRSLRLGLRNRRGLCFVRVPVAKQVPVRLGSIAAGDRNVELRIAPHAVLRDVEAGGLGLLLDADPPEALHRPEARERGGERERAYRGQAEQLDPDLVQ